ncbi:MAG: NADP-dependent phosphogluconate dehydrogenase [Ignavibacteriaceae bacterium]
MDNSFYELGMVGLGVMGRNLVLNFADHGFQVAGFDKDTTKVSALNSEGEGKKVKGVNSLNEFISILKKPRVVMMLVPAGAPVDSVINDVLTFLEPGDLIIDGGNSHFTDTNKRFTELGNKGIHFLGIGISGGEHGARFGPSMMPGGPAEAYERVRPIFEASSAKVKGSNCVVYLGPGSAGHYVKMVHNGIEYGLMQLISESYDLLKRGLNLSNDELHKIYQSWNEAELQSFLIEITADIFIQPDDKKPGMLIDKILDKAKQKGTGKWTSQDAMNLQVPLNTIDAAVAMRDMSAYKLERENAEKIFSRTSFSLSDRQNDFISKLRGALYFSMITTYAQGMAMLLSASKEYDYNLKLQDVARIWRGGCIIRAALLEDITKAFDKSPDLSNLLIDQGISTEIQKRSNDIRFITKAAIDLEIPVPAFSASLAYFDSFRSAWLPANLVQAQRDLFGAHTYERVDEEGVFHTQWNQK